jgi:carbonic anhydrase
VLRDVHLHAPSEHMIGGRQHAGELHLVHQHLMDGRFAVVAVLFEAKSGVEQTPHSVLFSAARALAESPPASGSLEAEVVFEPHGLLPESPTFYRYQGSLTTDAFSESVSWIVFEQAIATDDTHLAVLARQPAAGSRPVQDRDHRIVVRCTPASK